MPAMNWEAADEGDEREDEVGGDAAAEPVAPVGADDEDRRREAEEAENGWRRDRLQEDLRLIVGRRHLTLCAHAIDLLSSFVLGRRRKPRLRNRLNMLVRINPRATDSWPRKTP